MKYVAYYRVSTKKQSLGLVAQKECVKSFVKDSSLILAEFTEKESGSKNDRQELQKAIEACQNLENELGEPVKLIIAKLDRLSRSVSFIAYLMESDVKFVACDIPTANEMTLHIFASIAQFELKRTRARIKEALAQSDKELGATHKVNFTNEGRLKGARVNQLNALNNKNNRQAIELIKMYRREKLTFRAIAEKLNSLGMRTRNGKKFHATTVMRLSDRIQTV